jgi:hypothetical protein
LLRYEHTALRDSRSDGFMTTYRCMHKKRGDLAGGGLASMTTLFHFVTLALLLLLLGPTTVNAQGSETECRKSQTEYFDTMMKACAELQRTLPKEKFWGSACPFRFYPFVPTKKTPDMAAYRELAIEWQTITCMTLPRGPGPPR